MEIAIALVIIAALVGVETIVGLFKDGMLLILGFYFAKVVNAGQQDMANRAIECGVGVTAPRVPALIKIDPPRSLRGSERVKSWGTALRSPLIEGCAQLLKKLFTTNRGAATTDEPSSRTPFASRL